MANTNDSFIDEVAEAVRRDRLNLWFRRWGWVIGLLVVVIVGAAAWLEWSESRRETAAKARGEAILAAAETPETEARLAALADLPREGDAGVIAALILAAEQQSDGDTAAAAQTLTAIASDSAVQPLYRDLAALKAQMALGDEADRGVLAALAAPGAPFRLLALEQIAILDISAGERDKAIAALRSIREDAEVTPAQSGRVDALLAALAGPAEDVSAVEAGE